MDPHINERADQFLVTFKYNNLVRAGSPRQTGAICFAGAFAKHFHLVSNQACSSI